MEESCSTDKCQELSTRLVHIVSASLARETFMTLPKPALVVEIDGQQPLPTYLRASRSFSHNRTPPEAPLMHQSPTQQEMRCASTRGPNPLADDAIHASIPSTISCIAAPAACTRCAPVPTLACEA